VQLPDRDRVEVVQLFPTLAARHEQTGVRQHLQVLGDRHPGHVEVGRQLAERLTVVAEQLVQHRPPRAIGQRLEDQVHRTTIGNHLVSCLGL
jgi:hypothetical protein